MTPKSETVTETMTMDTDQRDNAQVKKPPMKIVWRNVILMIVLHLGGLYGAVLILAGQVMWKTVLFAYFVYVMSGLGITAGAHRLWAHRTYKAKLPLRILLCMFNNMAFQNHIYEWARDHRVHHKHSETDADPHNATRGFFFAHVGWLLCRKHPDVITKGKTVDLSDLQADPVLMFQRKYYLPLMLVSCFILPTIIPWYYWGETIHNSYFVATLFRYCFLLNMTWLVNSAAHMFGNRPYDQKINPRENILVSLGAIGEGFHNYHHTFPWDYSTSELGMKLNFTTFFIDSMARVGWAYDLKKVSKEVVKNRIERTGDGSRYHHHHDHEHSED